MSRPRIHKPWDLYVGSVMLTAGIALAFWVSTLLGAACLAGFLLLAIWRVPVRQIQFKGLDQPRDKLAELENEYRKTMSQIVGGIVLVGGFYFTWQQLAATREGQITTRFSDAIQQLGDSSVTIRLGGIYALERIAKDSPRDHWPIVEILTAFIRERFPALRGESPDALRCEAPMDRESAAVYGAPRPSPPKDLQAALDAIRRRSQEHDHGILDFAQTDLRGVNLGMAPLDSANFAEAVLDDAVLDGAYVRHATFGSSSLYRTSFRRAILNGSDFSRTNIYNTSFEEAVLSRSSFRHAYLIDVNLSEARADGADFMGSCLTNVIWSGIDLREARLEGAILDRWVDPTLLDQATMDVFTVLPEGPRSETVEIDGVQWFWRILRRPARVVYGEFRTADTDTTRGPHRVLFWKSSDRMVRSWVDIDSVRQYHPDTLRQLFASAYGRVFRGPDRALWRLEMASPGVFNLSPHGWRRGGTTRATRRDEQSVNEFTDAELRTLVMDLKR